MPQSEFDDPFALSAESLRTWLSDEIAAIEKARTLRVAEATALVDGYANGEISMRELNRKIAAYHERWDEPLPGVGSSEGLSDKQILARINRARSSSKINR